MPRGQKTPNVRDQQKQLCATLLGLPAEKRYDFIKGQWGVIYADRARPLLDQIAKVEEHLNK